MVDMYLAHEWLATHDEQTKQYAGMWIAVAESGILAYADSIKKLLNKLSGMGFKNPLITKVPTPQDAEFVL